MTTTPRILVADDDSAIRHLLLTLLRRSGFLATEAKNGSEALVAMGVGDVDAVILDLMMPVVSGWDVLRERAADPRLRCIPVIVLTACNLRDVTAGLDGQNVCALLAKPFDLPVLVAAVNECLAAPKAPCVAA